jgi:hypothetical protein
MCTNIVQSTEVEGCGKGASGWFDVTLAHVSYDHPFNARYEHALNIDFVNEAAGLGARVAVELSPESARRLAETILSTLSRGEAYEAAV